MGHVRSPSVTLEGGLALMKSVITQVEWNTCSFLLIKTAAWQGDEEGRFTGGAPFPIQLTSSKIRSFTGSHLSLSRVGKLWECPWELMQINRDL